MEYEESMLCVAATTVLIEWLKNKPDAVKYITDIIQNPGYDAGTSNKMIYEVLRSEAKKANDATYLGGIIEQVLRFADWEYALSKIDRTIK